MKQNRSRTCKH